MSGHIEKQCPNCGQQLRIPKNVGGILMACPSCGHKFSSDFKLGGVRKPKGVFMKIFEFPQTILHRIGRLFS
jgi:C4-type Zn-finger protein